MFQLLIVEDETSSREGLKHILSTIPDLTIATAINGKDGYMKALQKKPDIIISDIKMPCWDGLTMIEKLHDKFFPGKIFLLTGYAEFEYAQKALQHHVSDYILKPIVPTQIKELIEQTLRELRAQNNRINPQLSHLIHEIDEHILKDKLQSSGYTDYFLGVIYMEQERHLPDHVKEDLLKELNFQILILPDKHYRGIIIGFKNNLINHAAIGHLSSLLSEYQHLVCIYHILHSDHIDNLIQLFEMLQDAIPWSITRNSVFLAYDSSMQTQPMPYTEDAFFRKDLQRLLCNEDYAGYHKMLLKKINQLQHNFEHPKTILMTAISSLVKLNSKQVYLEAVNQMSSAKTIHEIINNLNSYFTMYHSLSANKQYSKLIQNAIGEIEENYKEPISLNSTADKLGITPQYLSRLFNKETSTSFINYLTTFRIEKAKELLRNSTLKINEICCRVGYTDAKYFCTLFKKTVGVTPNQYRN